MRTSHKTYLYLALFLIAALSVSKTTRDAIRAGTVSLFSPYFAWISSEPSEGDQKMQGLLLENSLLKNEVALLKQAIRQQTFPLPLETEYALLPARVVYRPLNSWSRFLWVAAGEGDNRQAGKSVIAKNSPVLLGNAVVGVVDFVGEKQSRIRLITDPGLNPSVRVKRKEMLLAKGEMRGASPSAHKGREQLLLGAGFNYDFPDDQGPARDLRSGEPLNRDPAYPALPLLLPGDLLITTGMDGVFPPGLEVGRVQRIFPLKEGDFSYELEAAPAAGSMNSLTLLFILSR